MHCNKTPRKIAAAFKMIRPRCAFCCPVVWRATSSSSVSRTHSLNSIGFAFGPGMGHLLSSTSPHSTHSRFYLRPSVLLVACGSRRRQFAVSRSRCGFRTFVLAAALAHVQVVVCALLRQPALVCAALHDLPVIDHPHLV